MKTIYFLTTFVFFHCLILQGQVEATEVVSGLNYFPNSLVVNGDYLYFANRTEDEIFRIDLTDTEPTVNEFVTGLDETRSLALNGNYLYVADGSFSTEIYRIDLTATMPTLESLGLMGLSYVNGMVFIGNTMYISEHKDEGSRVSRVDLAATMPELESLGVEAMLVGVGGLALNGDYLYVANNDRVSKIDLTETTPTLTNLVTGFSGISNLAFIGDYLYVCDLILDKISRIDVTETMPTATNVLAELEDPFGVFIEDNIMYFTERGAISKLDLTTLSVADIPNELVNLSISPNPASDFLQVSGLKATEKYAIYNVLGAKIKSGEVSNNEEIEIRNLSKGLYFLKLESDGTYQFIKDETK
jgi:DNA-binding beta-propeller fold protein YncE